MPVKLQAAAPAFKGVNQNNETIASKDLKGQWYVLYFYPKDNTSGCTKQACDFRDSMKTLAKFGVAVVGISPDSVKSHQKFIKDHDLNFSLIADEDKTICEKYGVWVQKSMYGRSYMGVERTTFIIDPDGKIRNIYPKVKVPGHVDEVKTWLKEHAKS
ncbi:MAG: thioredoxin-dependent thiol peroxidase [Candidatus Kapaibacteriota bacterium]